MSGVDDRVVAMKFDNKQFESGTKQSMASLDKLKKSMDFSSTKKGMADLQASTKGFNLNPMSAGIQGVNKAWAAMATVAITALANITNRAVDAGLSLVKSLSLDPILAGYKEYETNLNSIQTILANTEASGATLDDVNKALQELNRYSDKTIYNFSEMAKNIGTFTAAGVDLKTSTQAIKGIANLAALSGSNSQQASTAMYQLSQAISAGRVSLQDWNSVVNAGMGGTVFQRALAETATKMGTLDEASVKLVGKMKNVTIAGDSFRNSIAAKPGEKSWLTSKVLTQTLSHFTGDLTDAQLAAEGFNKSQIKAIQQTAATATKAATRVKSITQLIDVAKETAGSGWAQTWQLVFGDFKEARSTFTGASNAVNGFINNMSNARNKILKDWKELGGRTVLIDGIKAAFEALGSVLKPIKEAFRSIFPATTGKDLFDLTVKFRDFMESLKIGEETAENLKRTFAGVFAVFSIAKQIIGGLVGVIADLIGGMGDGAGSFLDFTGGIGDFLVSVDEALKKGEGLNKFFAALKSVLQVPLTILGAIRDAIFGLFDGWAESDATALSNGFGRIGERFEGVSKALDAMTGFFGKAIDIMQPFISGIIEQFSNLGSAIADGMGTGNFDSAIDIINTGLLGGILLLVKKFMTKGINLDLGGGLFKNISGTFEALTGSMKAMQNNIQADTLQKIAIAIGILTASVVALSLIDSKKLTKALTAMSVGFAQLLGSMAILTSITKTGGFLKIPFIAASMILLSTAVLILSAAVAVLSRLSWEELAKGLGAVAVLMGVLAAASKPLSANSAGMIRAGAAMILLAVGLRIMANALQAFATMSWSEMAKGLVGVAGSLLVIAGAMKLMPTNMVLQAAALVILAVALRGMAEAVQLFADISWGELLHGLVGIGGSLLVIAGAMQLMPPNMIASAAALWILSKALGGISDVVQSMGGMSWKEIAKGLVTLAGALGIIALAMYGMSGALGGAAALLVVSAALAIFVPVLVKLSELSWGAIGKGLLALAAAFVVIGVAGLLLTPIIPALLGLGIALALVGAGMALFGAGALALATAFNLIAVTGSAAATVVAATMLAIIELIPQAAAAFAEGIVAFLGVIVDNLPAFAKAFVSIFNTLLDAVIKVIPKVGRLITVLINTILNILKNAIPRYVATAIAIMEGILRGLAHGIPGIVRAAVDVIVAFLGALGDNLPRIVDAGAKMIIKLVNGIAQAIRDNSDEMGEAGANLGLAVIEGMASAIEAAVHRVVDAAINVAKAALDGVKDFLHIGSPSKVFQKEVGERIPQGMAIGIKKASKTSTAASEQAGKDALSAMQKTLKAAPDYMKAANVDSRPIITPVLDLSKVKEGSRAMVGMLSPRQQRIIDLNLTPAEEGAKVTAEIVKGSRARNNEHPELERRAIKFEQHNHSPKALSEADIYRSTKNQLSLAREVLE